MSNPTIRLSRYITCILLACLAATLTAIPVFAQSATVTMVGAGDIASCSSTRDSTTANLLARIPGTVFVLGDNVYPDGTAAQFRNCYHPTWGAHKARTRPAVGNHEYHTPDASAYFNYFGALAGTPSRGYYTYKRGSWRVIVLDSNCSEVGGCGPLSRQGKWLRQLLARSSARCTLAYFHHPLFVSTGAAAPEVKPFWNMLYSHNVDVILNGHAHYYERFAPQRPDGIKDLSRGIREFVVGTGGAPPVNPMTSPRMRNSVVDSEKSPGVTAYGVLKLDLSQGSYAWRFRPVAGETFIDSGTGRCH